MHAYALALETAGRTGGVVRWPMPLGTETVLDANRVKDHGFEGHGRIVRMDFPGFSLPSLYLEDSAFVVIVHGVIRALQHQPSRVNMLVNARGGKCRPVTPNRIVAKESDLGELTLLHVLGVDPGENNGGHAEMRKTGLIPAPYVDIVDLHALPETLVFLKNTEFGILDHPTCLGDPTPDFSVRSEQDSRFATEAEGQACFANELNNRVEMLQETLHVPGAARPRRGWPSSTCGEQANG